MRSLLIVLIVALLCAGCSTTDKSKDPKVIVAHARTVYTAAVLIAQDLIVTGVLSPEDAEKVERARVHAETLLVTAESAVEAGADVDDLALLSALIALRALVSELSAEPTE